MTRGEVLAWCVLVTVGGGLLACSWPDTKLGEFASPGLITKEFDGAEGPPRRYVLYVPPEYDSVHPLPLIVFLHGLSDIGFDGRRQLTAGLGPFVWSRHRAGDRFPYFVLFPQAREKDWGADTEDSRAVLEIMDRTAEEYRIDPDRIFLTGMSMGGEGCLELASHYPNRWAAVVPIACEGLEVNVDRIKSVPVRWYQNTYDSAYEARRVVAQVNRAGGNAELVEFDTLGHDAWTKAYSDPGLYVWLDRQVRRSPQATDGSSVTMARVGSEPKPANSH